MEACPRVKLYSILEEFPWLKELGNPVLCDSVSVRRADERLMESVPWGITMILPAGYVCQSGVKVALYDNYGVCLGFVQQTEYLINHDTGQAQVTQKGERILAACYRVGAERVYYIAWVEYGYGCFNRGCVPTNWRCMVYKPHNSRPIQVLADEAWTVERAFEGVLQLHPN